MPARCAVTTPAVILADRDAWSRAGLAVLSALATLVSASISWFAVAGCLLANLACWRTLHDQCRQLHAKLSQFDLQSPRSMLLLVCLVYL